MAFSLVRTNKNSGFTFIELLIVITIMGLLTATIAFSIREMIRRGKIAKAQGDINRIVIAIRQLQLDTNLYPNKENPTVCNTSGGTGGSSNEIYFSPGSTSMANLGLFANFVSPVSTWKGPYLDESITEISLDPWGLPYVYDGDYQCVEGIKGCERYVGGGTNDRVVTSYGEDRTQYTSDDIVYVFCGST